MEMCQGEKEEGRGERQIGGGASESIGFCAFAPKQSLDDHPIIDLVDSSRKAKNKVHYAPEPESGFAPGSRLRSKAIWPEWCASCSHTWNHLQ